MKEVLPHHQSIHLYDSMYLKFEKAQTKVSKSRSIFAWRLERQRERGINYTVAKGNFLGDEYIHYLDRSESHEYSIVQYMYMYICEYMSKLKLYCTSIIPQKKLLQKHKNLKELIQRTDQTKETNQLKVQAKVFYNTGQKDREGMYLWKSLRQWGTKPEYQQI